MSINRFSTPARIPDNYQFFQAPYEVMQQGLAGAQAIQDSAHLGLGKIADTTFNYLKQDEDKANEILAEIDGIYDDLYSQSDGGDFRKVHNSIRDAAVGIARRFKPNKDIGSLQANYNTKMEWLKRQRENKNIDPAQLRAMESYLDANYKKMGFQNPDGSFNGYPTEDIVDSVNISELTDKYGDKIKSDILATAYATAGKDAVDAYIRSGGEAIEFVRPDEVGRIVNNYLQGDTDYRNYMEQGLRIGLFTPEQAQSITNAALMGAIEKYSFSKQSKSADMKFNQLYGKILDNKSKNQPVLTRTGQLQHREGVNNFLGGGAGKKFDDNGNLITPSEAKLITDAKGNIISDINSLGNDPVYVDGVKYNNKDELLKAYEGSSLEKLGATSKLGFFGTMEDRVVLNVPNEQLKQKDFKLISGLRNIVPGGLAKSSKLITNADGTQSYSDAGFQMSDEQVYKEGSKILKKSVGAYVKNIIMPEAGSQFEDIMTSLNEIMFKNKGFMDTDVFITKPDGTRSVTGNINEALRSLNFLKSNGKLNDAGKKAFGMKNDDVGLLFQQLQGGANGIDITDPDMPGALHANILGNSDKAKGSYSMSVRLPDRYSEPFILLNTIQRTLNDEEHIAELLLNNEIKIHENMSISLEPDGNGLFEPKINISVPGQGGYQMNMYDVIEDAKAQFDSATGESNIYNQFKISDPYTVPTIFNNQ